MQNKSTLFIALLLLFVSKGLHAQFAKSPHVIRDPRLDKLVDKQIELNKEALKSRVSIEQGFRILVIATNKRDIAIEAKSTLLKNFPDQKSYMFYQSPNFKVLFGNYRTEKEAEEMRKQLQELFKDPPLIVPSTVEVKGEKTDSETP
ncbi:MAG: SPOR domain-containing protein [bacterium]|jgi:hypothetical protein